MHVQASTGSVATITFHLFCVHTPADRFFVQDSTGICYLTNTEYIIDFLLLCHRYKGDYLTYSLHLPPSLYNLHPSLQVSTQKVSSPLSPQIQPHGVRCDLFLLYEPSKNLLSYVRVSVCCN